MQHLLNRGFHDLPRIAEEYAASYQSNPPFPNIHFENFFNPETLSEVLAEFPDLSSRPAQEFNNATQRKLAGRGEAFFGPKTRELMHFLNSEPFLSFLQQLTGIGETLVGDPYFIGGGQHEIKAGGHLKLHADFNRHTLLALDRRVNVLVYLNKEWKAEYGGDFELWNRELTRCVKAIPPTFNTMAIFSTSDFSYHGHPDPLTCPPDRSRKSLALYYYSSGRPAEEIIVGQETHSTLFKARAGHAADEAALLERNRGRLGLRWRDFVPPVVGKLVRHFR